jgi:hypothetical protein
LIGAGLSIWEGLFGKSFFIGESLLVVARIGDPGEGEGAILEEAAGKGRFAYTVILFEQENE